MGLTGIPPTGPVPVAGSPTANQPGSIVNIWNLTPTTSIPVGGQLRLTAGTYTPAPTVFPASTTSAFPLGLFRGLNLRVVVSLTTVGAGSWTGTFTGTGTLFIVAGGAPGGPSSPLYKPSPSSPTLSGWLGGGGGAGGVSTTPYAITKGTAYPYTIGSGGSAGAFASGGNTDWNGVSVYGGGYGGTQGYGGGGGGCGGGGSVTANPPGNTYTGSPGGFGYNNFPGGAAGPTSYNYGGGGGGGGGAPPPISYLEGPGTTFPYTGGTVYSVGSPGAGPNFVSTYGGGGGSGYFGYGVYGGPTRTIFTGSTGNQGIIIIAFG